MSNHGLLSLLTAVATIISPTTGQRDYSITFHTADRSGCASSDKPELKFLNATGHSTSTVAITPAPSNENSTQTFTDIDIGEIAEVYISATSSNAWCFDWFYFSVASENIYNSETAPIQRRCSMAFQSDENIDNDCSGNFGVRRARLNVSSGSPICWNIYNTSLTNITDTAYDKTDGFNRIYSTAPDVNSTRVYAASFTTATEFNETGCASVDSVTVKFQSNCSFYTGGELVEYCNTDYVIETGEYSFTPVGNGIGSEASNTVYVNFTDYDIGNITHMTLTATDSDAWCLGKFNVLLSNNGTNGRDAVWTECDLSSFIYYGIIIQTGCSFTLDGENWGGYSQYTLRIDEFVNYCSEYKENTLAPVPVPTAMPVATSVYNNSKYIAFNDESSSGYTPFDARRYCMEHYGQFLASIENSTDNTLADEARDGTLNGANRYDCFCVFDHCPVILGLSSQGTQSV